MDPCICIFDDRREMTEFLVQRWSQIALECIGRKGLFVAALSGGATPADFYRALCSTRDALPWDKTHIFLVDERCVPFSDSDSNYGMIRSLLIEALKLPEGNIHAIKADGLSPLKAAEAYEAELKHFFDLMGEEAPVFDFIGLGIGADGHTASLFQGSPEAEEPLVPEKKRLAVAVRRDSIKHLRISLTLTVINKAKNVVFIVTGKNKAAIVKRVAEERDQGFPASRVDPSNGTLTFVLDSEAASMLNS
jgi:6-phosphogluconolactonase